MTTLTELTKLKTEYQEKLKTAGKSAFTEFLKEYFEANPTIGTVAWTQYTPSFNDGDACVFEVHGVYFSPKCLTEFEVAALPAYVDDSEDFVYVGGREAGGIENELGKHEDLLKVAFGDGVRVVATKDALYVDEIDHD